MGLEENYFSVFWVIHKSKDKRVQFNLSNYAPTVTVISRTFSGISFRINSVLDIGLTQPSKFPINIKNEVSSKTERGVYASSHRRKLSSYNCNFLRDLGSYGFTKCANTCMIPFEEVGVLYILTSFWTVPLWPMILEYTPPPPSTTILNVHVGII